MGKASLSKATSGFSAKGMMATACELDSGRIHGGMSTLMMIHDDPLHPSFG